MKFIFIFTVPLGWAKLAYWEFSERVGPQYPIVESTVNIFSEQVLHGDGLCLTALANHHQQRCTQPSESVLKTRRKIGLGKCQKTCLVEVSPCHIDYCYCYPLIYSFVYWLVFKED